MAATYVLERISQPIIDREVALALEQVGELVYDADLTGRPVSSTSSSYPNTAFGHMGDTIELGYQAALVSLHSPTYGRLWLANELHPGDTVSMTLTQALVKAAEKRIGRRPQRRTELLAEPAFADSNRLFSPRRRTWQVTFVASSSKFIRPPV